MSDAQEHNIPSRIPLQRHSAHRTAVAEYQPRRVCLCSLELLETLGYAVRCRQQKAVWRDADGCAGLVGGEDECAFDGVGGWSGLVGGERGAAQEVLLAYEEGVVGL